MANDIEIVAVAAAAAAAAAAAVEKFSTAASGKGVVTSVAI